jgi:hypothetical protein
VQIIVSLTAASDRESRSRRRSKIAVIAGEKRGAQQKGNQRYIRDGEIDQSVLSLQKGARGERHDHRSLIQFIL